MAPVDHDDYLPSAPLPTPPNADEYDVILPKNDGGCTFHFYETTDGKAAFRKYDRLPDGSTCESEVKRLIRRKHDIFIAVDGVSLQDMSYKDARALLKRCFRKKDFVSLRMKDCKGKRSDGHNQGDTLQQQQQQQSEEQEFAEMERALKGMEINFEDTTGFDQLHQDTAQSEVNLVGAAACFTPPLHVLKGEGDPVPEGAVSPDYGNVEEGFAGMEEGFDRVEEGFDKMEQLLKSLSDSKKKRLSSGGTPRKEESYIELDFSPLKDLGRYLQNESMCCSTAETDQDNNQNDNNASPMLDEALTLAQNLTSLMSQKNKGFKETIETMSDMMEQTSHWGSPPPSMAGTTATSVVTTDEDTMSGSNGLVLQEMAHLRHCMGRLERMVASQQQDMVEHRKALITLQQGQIELQKTRSEAAAVSSSSTSSSQQLATSMAEDEHTMQLVRQLLIVAREQTSNGLENQQQVVSP